MFAMDNLYLNAKLLVEMLPQVLGTIDAAMLSAGAAETEHQMGKTALDITGRMLVGQSIDVVEKLQYLPVVFEKPDDRLIEAGEFFVGFVSSGIMGRPAVEDVSAAIARWVGGQPFVI